jgi:glycerol-3-phosphate acyltransferase PlsY
MVEAALLIVGAYLIGSIPTGYLVSRYVAGIDIRDYGSGNVGASNVIAHVGKWQGILQGSFDCLIKGLLPVLVARLIGLDLWVQGVAGFVAVTGHNWSPFLRFTGGRGVSVAVGAALGLGMFWEILILGIAVFTVGRLLTRDTGFWTFAALLVLPIAGLAFRRESEIILTIVLICLMMYLKRLTANWERPPPEYPLRTVLMYRLVWDRDVPKRAEWTERRPD